MPQGINNTKPARPQLMPPDPPAGGGPVYPRPGAAPCPPVRGRLRVPPSGGGPVSPRPARTPDPPRGAPTLTHPRIQNLFCFKLDAKSVPEALATTFLIM